MCSLDEAKRALEHLLPDFEYVVLSALTDYVEKVPYRHVYSKRCEANMKHDWMRHHARERFDTHDEVEVVAKGNLVFLEVRPKKSRRAFAIKLKLLDEDLLPKNILTQQVFNFMNQGPLEDDQVPGQLVIEGADELFKTNLVLGYQQDEVATLDSAIWMVCPQSIGSTAWSWQIEPTTSLGEIVPFTESSSAGIRRKAVVDDQKKRVRRKGAAGDASDDETRRKGEAGRDE